MMNTVTAPGGRRPLDQANRLEPQARLYWQPVNCIHHRHLLLLLFIIIIIIYLLLLQVRCDSGITEGSEISIYYDPMICKVTYFISEKKYLHLLSAIFFALVLLSIKCYKFSVHHSDVSWEVLKSPWNFYLSFQCPFLCPGKCWKILVLEIGVKGP